MSLPAVPDSSDEAVMKKNAAEQAAALNQDPGGADRAALLAARLREAIVAGTEQVRTKHPEAQWFGEASLGLFIHWGIASVDGDMDLSWPMVFNMGSGKKMPPVEYWKLAEGFKAERYDPKVWLQAAKDAGYDYAVLTAKHHDGYTLWPTETTDLGVRTHLGGRDLFGEYVAACRAVGLKVGVYYSGPDWWFEHPYMSFNYRSESGGNSSLPSIPGRQDYDAKHQPTKVPKMPPEERKRIRTLMRAQLTELLTRYGRMDVLWFDGGTGSNMTLEEMRTLQPSMVINNRGRMTEREGGPIFEGDYFTVEHGDQPTRPPGWWEQLRIWNAPSWGYQRTNETRYSSTAYILRTLARTKAWGGVTMTNVGPRPDGTLPQPYFDGMSAVAQWMHINGESIHGASPIPLDAEANVPVTSRGKRYYLHAVPLPKGVSTMELRPSAAHTRALAATILGTGEAVPFSWSDGRLSIERAARPATEAHEVIAVDFD